MAQHLPPDQEKPTNTSAGRRRLFLALLVLLVLSSFAVHQSPMLRAQSVAVTGLRRLTQERVLEAAGISIGAARWELSAGELERRLLQEPWIKSARVRWEWSRLEIDIEERTPISLLPYQGKWLSLDESGTILELVNSPAAQRLPVLSGVSAEKAVRGSQLNHPGLIDALLVVSWMAESLRNRVSQVEIAPDRNITLYLMGGGTVRWGLVPEDKGRIEEVQQKLQSLGTLLQDIPRLKAPNCVIDLRVAGRAYHAGCQ